MPAPSQGYILSLAQPSFTSGPNPEAGTKLGGAFAKVVANACQAFVERVQVPPGVACVVPPPPGPPVGTVTGIGKLMGPLPSEMEVKLEAERAVKDSGMSAADQTRFAETLAKMVTKGFARVLDLATVLPGTPIAGGITSGPARIQMFPGVVATDLRTMARALTPPAATGPWVSAQPQAMRQANMPMMGGHRNPGLTAPPGPPRIRLPDDFAALCATLLEKTLAQMESQVMVAPGIQVAGMVTVTPGRLI